MTSFNASMNSTGSNMMGNRTGVNPPGGLKQKVPSGYKAGSLAQFTPEQMQLFQQMFGNVGPESYLSKLAGGDEETFNEMEAPALRQFSELQGGLASRFSGMGGLGARNSSGFQNSANAQASNFAQELQGRRQGLQQQAIKDLMGLSGELLGQRPYENYLVPKQENQTAGLIGKLGGAIPGLVSSFMGGGSPGSALKGAASIFGGG